MGRFRGRVSVCVMGRSRVTVCVCVSVVPLLVVNEDLIEVFGS